MYAAATTELCLFSPSTGNTTSVGTGDKGATQQYRKVLTQLSANTFAQEMGKASLNIVWPS